MFRDIRLMQSLLAPVAASLVILGSGSPAIASEPIHPIALRLDMFLSRMVPFGFSGSVLIEHEGSVILHRGYGWAETKNRLPNNADTLFPIESISKQFTATCCPVARREGADRLEHVHFGVLAGRSGRQSRDHAPSSPFTHERDHHRH